MTDEPDLLGAARVLATFTGTQLTTRIAALESRLGGVSAPGVAKLLQAESVSRDLLASAYLLKRVAGQINVVIHAVRILLCLPTLLEADERVEYLSLGAGNTGRPFDLETDRRVAEFKFIHWQGGPEVIRQNALFKDFYLLAEHSTPKRKYLYVLGTEHPLRFLNGGRALTSVMSRNRKLWEGFRARYGDRFATVGEYYRLRRTEVIVEDVIGLLPELLAPAEPSEEQE